MRIQHKSNYIIIFIHFLANAVLQLQYFCWKLYQFHKVQSPNCRSWIPVLEQFLWHVCCVWRSSETFVAQHPPGWGIPAINVRTVSIAVQECRFHKSCASAHNSWQIPLSGYRHRPSIRSSTKIAEAKCFYCIVFHPLMEISLACIHRA